MNESFGWESPPPSRDDPPPPGGDMRERLLRSAVFRKGREKGWRRLETLIDRVERDGIRTLSPGEARELPLLYRLTASSLSVARGTVLDRNLLLYLENLTLRAYLVVYGPRTNLIASALAFFRRGFPRAVRGMRPHLAFAAAVLLAGSIAGCLLVMDEPRMFAMLVPASLAGERGPDSTAGELREAIFAPYRGFAATFVSFANSLFRHNAMVGILSFGLGLILGIPTVLLLAYNGLIVGAMVAIHLEKGLAVDFLGWLLIHGITELTAILLCAAAGLVVAEKIVFPGKLPRLENLARNGRPAASVAAGAVVMFFIAGILEGGLRQFFASTPLRWAVALVTAGAWLWYFAGCGKDGGR